MSNAAQNYDVIVVGGGLAGLAMGLALSDAKLSVAVVDPLKDDAQTRPEFDGRASAIAYANFRMLERLGAGARLRERAQRIETILVTDGRAGDPLTRSGPGAAWLRFIAEETGAAGEPLGFMVENRHMRQALLAASADKPGLTRVTGVGVADLAFGHPHAEVHLSDQRTLSAPLVVGCDGRASVVRQAMGVRVNGWAYDQWGLVATVRHERPHEGVAHEYFLPAGPFAILPLTGNRASLVWTERARAAKAALALPEHDFLLEIRRRFGDFLGRVDLEGPRFGYPLELKVSQRLSGPRAVLAGDAARRIHPIAGQGFNLGLKDAAALRDVLAEATLTGEDLGAQTTLERYERWRRFDGAMLAAATDVFTRVYSNDLAPLRLARDAAMALVNRIPAARTAFARNAGADMGELPSLLRR